MQPYQGPSVTLAGGGNTPYTCTISSGALPGGLGLNASTCVISGTPSALGTFNFTISATDSGTPAQSARARGQPLCRVRATCAVCDMDASHETGLFASSAGGRRRGAADDRGHAGADDVEQLGVLDLPGDQDDADVTAALDAAQQLFGVRSRNLSYRSEFSGRRFT